MTVRIPGDAGSGACTRSKREARGAPNYCALRRTTWNTAGWSGEVKAQPASKRSTQTTVDSSGSTIGSFNQMRVPATSGSIVLILAPVGERSSTSADERDMPRRSATDADADARGALLDSLASDRSAVELIRTPLLTWILDYRISVNAGLTSAEACAVLLPLLPDPRLPSSGRCQRQIVPKMGNSQSHVLRSKDFPAYLC